ncbi:MAG: TRAP transporter small permease [Hyphomicrobiales bacterium]|nr:TRAP transporter small permease [Hyphomicrobiales bacterium]MCP5371178.1 TRAP transporter small permease [Hyphomicrobiales bacterium]
MTASRHLLGRAVNVMARLLGGFAAVLLFSMMMLTFVDVIGRYFFTMPVPGGFEITEIMLASLIFAGLPLVTVTDEHVTVDLFDFMFPSFMAHYRDVLMIILSAVMMSFICHVLWIKAGEALDYGDVTAVLLIPMAPVTYFMCAMTGFTALLMFMFGFAKAADRTLQSLERYT